MKRGPDPTSERIYRVVKQQVLDGAFRPGERIEAAQLADLHNASITPVRAALHRLVGEQLVDARPSEGFHALQISEHSLRDLYDWNGQVLQIALQLSSPAPINPDATAIPIGDGQDAVAAVARLFLMLGERTGNEVCAHAIRSLNDRLHLVRRIEHQVLGEVETELAALVAALTDNQPNALRPLLVQYHRRRHGAATDIVRRLHRRLGPVP